jgi:hypothetical protein
MYRYPSIDHINITKDKWAEKLSYGENNYKYYIEEKMDGSQLTVMLNKKELVFYNKGSKVNTDATVFNAPCTMLELIKNELNPNYIYHGESICRIKHNTVVYSKTPKHYYILYDIYDTINNQYLNHNEIKEEAKRLGLNHAQLLYENNDPSINPIDKCEELIKAIEEGKLESCLGGTLEGIVLKHPKFMNKDGDLMAMKLKCVTNNFKERHRTKQQKTVRSIDDFIEFLGLQFSCTARFNKAYQHLRDRNESITYDNIKNELDIDFEKEYKKEIMMNLYLEFGPIIKRHARSGLSKWHCKLLGIPVENEEESRGGYILWKYGITFAKEKRFTEIYNDLKNNQQLINNKKDIHKLSEKMDKSFDEKYKDDATIFLWDQYHEQIKTYAKKDMDEWFNNLIME